MQQANFTHPRPERRADSSGWPEGYFGKSSETSHVLCPSCYRRVHAPSSAEAPLCPRCGVKLDLENKRETSSSSRALGPVQFRHPRSIS
jgi:predicted RNA-binding Zn-ribbon protein involved in translation (DUF1610 family)